MLRSAFCVKRLGKGTGLRDLRFNRKNSLNLSIFSGTGKTFSAHTIARFLKSEHRTVSIESIYNYLKWLEQAFIIYPCRRYDLQ